jgi:diadenosine tetraphosphate (Ap4A) HIT family hydrolase
MDAAALGIPMICSERSETAKVLYPHTLVNPYDVGEIRELTERLLNDIVFYHNVVSTALERVAEFDMFKTKTRLLNHLSND